MKVDVESGDTKPETLGAKKFDEGGGECKPVRDSIVASDDLKLSPKAG